MAKKSSSKKSDSVPNTRRKIGFVLKRQHPEAAELAAELVSILVSRGYEALIADESAGACARLLKAHSKKKPSVRCAPKPDLVKLCDLIVVLGGDGTLLSIARLMRDRSVPVMGINMGQLGFLTEFKKSEASRSLASLLDGEQPVLSERVLLEVTLTRKNKVIFQGPVVNEAVVSKGAIARIIGMQVGVGGKWINTIRADGLIVATPTGSTAYSLAAGGPIIEPSLHAVVLAPICPHSLTQRPLVIPDRFEIQIKLGQLPGDVFLTLDGQDAVDMKENDVVTVRRFKKHSLKLISAPNRDYFSLLREKLNFGMRD